MNRKQKIIVSVTGIFLVALILVGLTYAYFLTQIKGNTNSKSISVTTANLKLTYSDNSAEILGENIKLKPSEQAIGTKNFEVSNEGDATHYAIIIENVTVKDANTGKYTVFNSNDFVYTLTCETNLPGKTCNGVSTQTTLPMSDAILIENDIDTIGEIHSYTLTLWYLDNGKDQSADMNKTLQAKINIEDPNRLNPYSDDTTSLAYNIINNAMSTTSGGSKFMVTPPSKVAEEISLSDYPQGVEGNIYPSDLSAIYYYGPKESYNSCNPFMADCTEYGIKDYSSCNDDVVGKYLMYGGAMIEGKPVESCDANGYPVLGKTKYESVLSATEDDDGRSYYYRGNVEDNYVNFNNMCWRIVRIEGDGAIKLVLEDQYDTCEQTTDTDGDGKTFKGDWYVTSLMQSTTMYDSNNLFNAQNVVEQLNAWYNSSISNKTRVKTDTTWCYGDITNVYSTNSPYDKLSQTRTDAISAGTEFYYDARKRIEGLGQTPSATLLCDKNGYSKHTGPIGTVTADEAVFAGATGQGNNRAYYLENSYQKMSGSENILLSLSGRIPDSTLMQLYEENFVLYNGYIASMSYPFPVTSAFFRPAISLQEGTPISDGTGTQLDPYEIG